MKGVKLLCLKLIFIKTVMMLLVKRQGCARVSKEFSTKVGSFFICYLWNGVKSIFMLSRIETDFHTLNVGV